MERVNYSSGAPLEEIGGYSRAVKMGPFIYVGGTTSVQPDGSVYGEGDSYAQVKYVLEKQLSFVKQAGGEKEDVFFVKIYTTPGFAAEDGLRAYSELFAEVKPILTVVGIEKLTRPAQLVEIEMNAVRGCAEGGEWMGMDLTRTNFASDDPLEESLGFSRMVKIGPFVYIGATTSVMPDGSVYAADDATEQENYILKKQIQLLSEAGASAADVVKVKMYRTPEAKKYRKKETQRYYVESLKPVKPLLTGITIASLASIEQVVAVEMTAIIGCGQKEHKDVWGELDFARTNYSSGAPLEETVGYSRMVKVGPFVYIGGTTSVQPDGSVYGEEDARAQENYVFEKEIRLLAQAGGEPKDVIKVKNYRTPEHGKYINKDVKSYYAEVLKPVKPLNTAVTIHSLNRPTQLAEIAMTAILASQITEI